MKITDPIIDQLFSMNFCLYPNVYREKRPACKQGFKDATKDKDQFVKLVARLQEFNTGIATGREQNLVVIDVDPKNGGDISFNKLLLEYGDEILNTFTVLTSNGGFHLYFSYPEDFIGKFPKELCRGVDIKADGGGVVGPGSVHPSGQVYTIKNQSSQISKLPSWILEYLKNNIYSPLLSTIFTNDGKIQEGGRNTTTHIFGCSLVKFGMPVEQIRISLHNFNKTCCVPPLPEKEVDTIATSLLRNSGISKKIEKPVFDKQLYGIAGDFVNLIEPHTEASKVGMYLQFLITFGSIIGKKAHIRIGASTHHTNEFLILVGNSAKGRKGSSMDIIEYIFKNRDPDFFKTCVKRNIASGEGIVEIVKDIEEPKNKKFNKEGEVECRF